MFRECSAFNQPLEKWNVSDVSDMQFMFFGCAAFNQSLEA
jgi:membrane-associated lipoprotein